MPNSPLPVEADGDSPTTGSDPELETVVGAGIGPEPGPDLAAAAA
jgi:hypothetical protein